VIYDIRHVTSYTYEAPVDSARCLLRVTPATIPGQALLASTIGISPKPQRVWERYGYFGERITCAEIVNPHTELRIEARSRAKLTREAPKADARAPDWERIRVDALATSEIGPTSPAHFVNASQMAPIHAPATDYARASFAAGRSILVAVSDLMTRIRTDFTFDPDATAVNTPMAEAFESRRGVCQDFTHVMIAALRGIGLPAAYVSGYLRTLPPPGKPRLEGADATHAWVNVWCGDELGWIGFDPTNALLVAREHVTVAIGRDYADVPPIQGVFLGFGAQTIKVSVDVTEST
jgi:transglutaminase-like putative cysteine protease